MDEEDSDDEPFFDPMRIGPVCISNETMGKFWTWWTPSDLLHRGFHLKFNTVADRQLFKDLVHSFLLDTEHEPAGPDTLTACFALIAISRAFLVMRDPNELLELISWRKASKHIQEALEPNVSALIRRVACRRSHAHRYAFFMGFEVPWATAMDHVKAIARGHRRVLEPSYSLKEMLFIMHMKPNPPLWHDRNRMADELLYARMLLAVLAQRLRMANGLSHNFGFVVGIELSESQMLVKNARAFLREHAAAL